MESKVETRYMIKFHIFLKILRKQFEKILISLEMADIYFWRVKSGVTLPDSYYTVQRAFEQNVSLMIKILHSIELNSIKLV